MQSARAVLTPTPGDKTEQGEWQCLECHALSLVTSKGDLLVKAGAIKVLTSQTHFLNGVCMSQYHLSHRKVSCQVFVGVRTCRTSSVASWFLLSLSVSLSAVFSFLVCCWTLHHWCYVFPKLVCAVSAFQCFSCFSRKNSLFKSRLQGVERVCLTDVCFE